MFTETTTGMRWTPEQAKIINMSFDLSDPRVTKVMAFAGSGKTSTLVELCRKNPTRQFLVIVFNKAIKLQWADLKLGNVKAYTAHSLAWNYWHDRGITKEQLGVDMKIDEHIDTSNVHDGRKWKKFKAQVKATVESFCHSIETSISIEHTPEKWPDSSSVTEMEWMEAFLTMGLPQPPRENCMKDVPHEERIQIFLEAQRLWKEIERMRRKDIVWGCSIYLKMFQLQKPDLLDIPACQSTEVLLIDEAQDLNPAMLDSKYG